MENLYYPIIQSPEGRGLLGFLDKLERDAKGTIIGAKALARIK